jgi:peptidoglycan/LPS O-acetylase OafA/YrhL
MKSGGKHSEAPEAAEVLHRLSLQTQPTAHVPALDGIRGFAILLVLWHHVYMQPHPQSAVMQALYQLNHAAWIGVDLFFVLSGFLITGILYDSLGRKDYFRRFYRRRAVRIFPLYYGVLLLLLALSLPLALHWHGRQWLLLTYLQNVGVTQPFAFDISRWVSLNHFWSLSVEEQYYLVWPLVIWLIRDKVKLIWISLALSVAALALRFWLSAHVNAAFVFSSTPTRVDTLLIGSALAMLSRMNLALAPSPAALTGALARHSWRTQVQFAALRLLDRLSNWVPHALFASATAACVVIAIRTRGFEWWSRPVETVGFTFSALACVALVAMCLREGSWTQRFFQNPGLRFFGRYSYGLYVWHAFVYAGLRSPLVGRFGSIVGDLLCIAISVAIALASYHGFERWFLRMKEKLAKRVAITEHDLVGAD